MTQYQLHAAMHMCARYYRQWYPTSTHTHTHTQNNQDDEISYLANCPGREIHYLIAILLHRIEQLNLHVTGFSSLMQHSLIHNVVHNVRVFTYHSVLRPITTKKRKDLTSNIRSEGVCIGGGGGDDE